MKENSKVAVVSVSNRSSFAKNMGTRAIVLKKGEIIYNGDIEEAVILFQSLNK